LQHRILQHVKDGRKWFSVQERVFLWWKDVTYKQGMPCDAIGACIEDYAVKEYIRTFSNVKEARKFIANREKPDPIEVITVIGKI
jgi:hypothetical protein